MGPTGYPETSVTNYSSRLRNIPEERRSLEDIIIHIKRKYIILNAVYLNRWFNDITIIDVVIQFI